MIELLAGMFLIAVGSVVWAMRDNNNPAALWVWGWVLAGATPVLFWYSESAPWAARASNMLSPLLPGFLLAGALAYADRKHPPWLLPAALGVGLVRWGLAVTDQLLAADLVGIALEPAAYFYAGSVVWRAGRGTGRAVSQRALAPAFIANGAIELYGGTWTALGEEFPELTAMVWAPVAILTLGIQVTAAGHRGRSQQRALQAETAEARLALEQSNLRLAVIAEQSSDMIFESDVEGNLLYVSPNAAGVLGRSSDELSSASPFSWIHPDDLHYVREVHGAALASDEQHEFLVRTPHADGSWHWVETKMRSFVASNGERRLVGIARDVTQRQRQQETLERSHQELERRVQDRTTELVETVEKLESEVATRRSVESQLRVSRSRYRAISELSSDFAFGLRMTPDAAAEIEWVSDAFTRLTGYEPDDLRAGGWRKLVSPDHQRAARAQFERLFAGEPVEFEGFVTTRSGEERFFHTRITAAARDDDGKLTVVGATRDITARRRAEEERRELEHRIHEVQRLESLGVLAGGIAHDFNNLLSVILGNSALMLGELGDDDPLAQRVHRIRAAAQHAAGLTEQMLTYSGRTPAELKPVNLAAVVRGSQELLEASLDPRIDLVVEPSDAPVSIAGDTTQLRQIVVNLVTNAAEAMGEGGGSIRVRTTRFEVAPEDELHSVGTTTPTPGRYVCLEVSDTGPGMEEAVQQRIFEPFFTTRASGRGLGLAAVLGIVQGHAGSILLESTLGRGTTFRILFPQREAGEDQKPTKQTKQTTSPSPQRGRVLLVDDEPLVLEVGVELLRRAGFDVESASGGQEALEVLAAAEPGIELVVLDLIMPGLDGRETLRAIQSDHPGVAVILTSGYDEQGTADEYAVGFLRKPYDPGTLIEAVSAAIAD